METFMVFLYTSSHDVGTTESVDNIVRLQVPMKINSLSPNVNFTESGQHQVQQS